MKKVIYRVATKALAVILAFALIFGSVPVVNAQAAATDDYIVLEVKSQTNLKRDCYAKSETVCSMYPGELLYAVSAETNSYDNLWYRVLVAEEGSETGEVSEVYCYSGDVGVHECDFDVFETENATLHYCRCGQIQIKESGLSAQSDTLALNPTGILTPEEEMFLLGLVGTVKGYIAAAGHYISAAVPYLLVPVLVAGSVITIAMLCDGKTVRIDHVKENYKDYSEYDMEAGKYYCCLVLPDTKNLLFMYIPGTEMDIEGAAAFMTLVAQFNDAYQLGSKKYANREYYGNVYTLNFPDAERLCKKLVNTGLFTYGGDGGVGSKLSVDKRKIPGAEYYRHYHLHYAAGFSNSLMTHDDAFMGKVPSSHIFWGAPVGIRNAA